MKTILITGCSSGIGLASALFLKAKEYRVFATARNETDLAQLKSLGLDAVFMDLQSSDSIKHAIKIILSQTGGTLDALFNNAGYVQPGAIDDLSREMILKQFETNVFGPMEVIREILPIMRAQGFGRIIQNTSILGTIAMPFRGAYNASKFALEGFSQTLRQELINTTIHVSIIAPGPINTAIQKNAHVMYSNTVKLSSSIHSTTYSEMAETLVSPKTWFALQPDAVVKQLWHALNSPHPRARYYTGFAAKLLALAYRYLPETLSDRIAIHASK